VPTEHLVQLGSDGSAMSPRDRFSVSLTPVTALPGSESSQLASVGAVVAAVYALRACPLSSYVVPVTCSTSWYVAPPSVLTSTS
jgi:hypothetical protein